MSSSAPRTACLGVLVFVGLAAAAVAAAAGDEATVPTYSRDVAPILFGHCASCHRPGESAPFDLLTYADARTRARQIADVTRTRFMPPWLPASGFAEYHGQRGLSESQIDILARWADGGAPEGDPAELPPTPVWTEGWQLGEPDLVISFAEPYTLAADGPDIFRNFVVPVPVDEIHYVKAVEFRPGNARVVHHAVMRIDRTDASRRRDAADPEMGFGGMNMGDAELPDGQFLAWTPGRVPFPGNDEIAWRLEKGTDFIVQLHLHPSGKAEKVKPSVGFYFSEKPPTRYAWGIFMQSRRIDIPAGVRDYTVEDTYKVPVDLEVFSVYPHAHYLGKDMKAFATLPDGTVRWLVRIKDWDFNWQDEYRFLEPVQLPPDTVITMRYVYDNSSDNVRNPNNPPQRVVGGNQSTDEMANLLLGVLPRDERDLARLRESQLRQNLELNPDDWVAQFNLGLVLQAQGRLADAAGHLRRATQLSPANARTYANLGNVLQMSGQLDEAIANYREALRIDPRYVEAMYNLANAYQAQGRVDQAIELYRRALRVAPDDPQVHINLGNVLASQGSLELALQHYAEALRVAPDSVNAHANRGNVLAQLGRLEEAIDEFREAQRLAPDSEDVRYNLELALQLKEELDQAFALAQQSLALMREAEKYYAAGQLDQAVRTAERALELATRAQADEVITPIGQRLQFYKRARSGNP